MLQHIFPLFSQNNVSKFQCDTCELAKHHFVPFPACGNKSTKAFVIVHSDVWSPIVVSQSRFRWIVTFIDDYSRTTWVYLMKDKSDISLCFQIFHKMVRTQFNASIKIVHFDNGGEYLSNDL